MGTTIRPELSKNNPYWIEKHRYYELKHFCLQYRSWRKAYAALEGIRTYKIDPAGLRKENFSSDPTARCAIEKAFYSERMDMLKRVCQKADPIFADYILAAVIEGWSYDILKARFQIPCCKDDYYKLYRRFFRLLSIERK